MSDKEDKSFDYLGWKSLEEFQSQLCFDVFILFKQDVGDVEGVVV